MAAVDRPHPYLDKVFILHKKVPLFCVFRTALIKGYPSCAPCASPSTQSSKSGARSAVPRKS